MRTFKEFILDAIENTYIFEMTKSRSDLKRYIDDIAEPLFQHWCLIRYCALYDFGNKTKEHWIKEVRSYILKTRSVRTKGFDKTRLLREWYITKLELSDRQQMLDEWFDDKFEEENIIISDEEKDRIIDDWTKQVDKLCDAMGGKLDYKEYIEDYLLYVER